MFLVNQFSTGLMLVELFYFQNPTYHPDYFNELRNVVRDIERINVNSGARQFCLEVISRYLNSSSARFKFAKKFVEFCKTLAI